MKKTLLIILMLALSITAACAEATFTFRNGIVWGMSAADVTAAEGRECDIEYPFDEEKSLLFFENTTVSKYTSDMQFLFWGDQLRLVVYDFYGYSATDADGFTYLLGAMDSSYGASTAADPAEIASVLNNVVPELYLAEELTDCHVWQLTDATIYMFRYPGDSFAIVYTDSAFFEPVVGFDVSGL